MLRLAGGAALALAAPLPACSSSGTTQIRFLMNKPEVVGYFTELVAAYNDSQSAVRVFLDTTPTSITAQFIRGAPPDIACYNYNLEAGTFVSAGALSDLSDLPEAATIDPAVQDLVTQYASFEGETSVLPYSVTAAGVIYNPQLFDDSGVSVPTTYPELLSACETFVDAGVAPIFGTYRDTWTMQQGLFDYTTGSVVDVAAFYAELAEVGTDFEPGSELSFSRVLADPVARMVELAGFSNPDAPSRTYPDGNLAFGRAEAAMLLQGPWALGEIAKADPDLPVATFALPMTDDPADTKVRVNLDLALWIPRSTPRADAARDFLQYLMQPDVINAYNADNQASSPLRDAPAQPDERLAGLQPYVTQAAFYQGAGTYIPTTVPLGNYLQEALVSGDADGFLRTLDADWRRLALRSA